jgi:hypothetical protein
VDYYKPFKQEELAKNIAEIHCVSVCINPEEKILIAKRTNRNLDNNKWEFGCGQIHLGTNFEDFLISTYREDFKIEIEPLKVEEELQPVATYTLTGEKRKTSPGIIFVSTISETEIEYKNEKYSEIRLVNYEELLKYHDSDMVPLMKKNALAALYFLKTFKSS